MVLSTCTHIQDAQRARRSADISSETETKVMHVHIDNLLAIRKPGNYLKLRQLFEQQRGIH
jgi:hypothetical protein